MNLNDFRPSEAVRKRNPELFGDRKSKAPNQTELRCYDEFIRPMIERGDLVEVEFESRRFKLYTIKYTPDWCCRRPDGREVMYEVKPYYKNKKKVHWHPGSRERLKMAAALYPDIEFYAVWREPSGWITERIPSREAGDEPVQP